MDDQSCFCYFSLYLGHCLHYYKSCVTNAAYNKYNCAITYKGQYAEAWEVLVAPENQNLLTWRIVQHWTRLPILYSVRSPPLEVFRDQVDKGMADRAVCIIQSE